VFGLEGASTMNSLEKCLCDSMGDAFEKYQSVTGWWLWHAPEHFIQNVALTHIWEKGWEVYPEATIKKITQAIGHPRRGRPPKSIKNRFDLVVWNRSSRRLRAVVEIKRTSRLAPLKGDAARIKKAMSGARTAKSGYLIVYSEADARAEKKRPSEILKKRYADWAEELDLRIICSSILGEDNDTPRAWAAGFVLMRA
jgi:hypothetical protein